MLPVAFGLLLALPGTLPVDAVIHLPAPMQVQLQTPPPVADTQPRVRPTDDTARSLVEAAQRTSPTIAQLIANLDASNVVVYVRTALDLRTRGVLTFVAHGAPLTYVLIRIELRQRAQDRIATLGHELTHAVEIAEASSTVRSQADLAALYKQVGKPGGKAGEFESSRALVNEKRARSEQRMTARRE